MADKTPGEKLAEKIALMQLEAGSSEYQNLMRGAAIGKAKVQAEAKVATVGLQAEAAWLKKVHTASLILGTDATTLAMVRDADKALRGSDTAPKDSDPASIPCPSNAPEAPALDNKSVS